MKFNIIKNFFWVVFLFAGFFLFCNSFSSIIDFKILHNLDYHTSLILALIFIIIGIVFFILEKPSKSTNLAQEILENNNFPKNLENLLNVIEIMRFGVKEKDDSYIIFDKFKQPFIKISNKNKLTKDEIKSILKKLSREEEKFKSISFRNNYV